MCNKIIMCLLLNILIVLDKENIFKYYSRMFLFLFLKSISYEQHRFRHYIYTILQNKKPLLNQIYCFSIYEESFPPAIITLRQYTKNVLACQAD